MTGHVVKDCRGKGKDKAGDPKEGCSESRAAGSIQESGGNAVGSETKLENAAKKEGGGRSVVDEEGDEESFKQQAEEAEHGFAKTLRNGCRTRTQNHEDHLRVTMVNAVKSRSRSATGSVKIKEIGGKCGVKCMDIDATDSVTFMEIDARDSQTFMEVDARDTVRFMQIDVSCTQT